MVIASFLSHYLSGSFIIVVVVVVDFVVVVFVTIVSIVM